jgi:hypothetical protein
MGHVSEACEPTTPHLLTHVHTTAATVHEAQCTEPIQQALVEKALPPRRAFRRCGVYQRRVASREPGPAGNPLAESDRRARSRLRHTLWDTT